MRWSRDIVYDAGWGKSLIDATENMLGSLFMSLQTVPIFYFYYCAMRHSFMALRNFQRPIEEQNLTSFRKYCNMASEWNLFHKLASDGWKLSQRRVCTVCTAHIPEKTRNPKRIFWRVFEARVTKKIEAVERKRVREFQVKQRTRHFSFSLKFTFSSNLYT